MKFKILFFEQLFVLLALLYSTQAHAQLLSDKQISIEVGAFTHSCVSGTPSSTNLTKRGIYENCRCMGTVFFKGLTTADLEYIRSKGVSNQLVVNRNLRATQYCREWLEKQQSSLPANSLFFEDSNAIASGDVRASSAIGGAAQTHNSQTSGDLPVQIGETANINGMICTLDAGGLFRCNNGISCSLDAGGLTRCSNGSSANTDSLGLTRFSDGTTAETNSGGLTRFSNGLICDTDRMGLTRCNDGTTCSMDRMGLLRCDKK